MRKTADRSLPTDYLSEQICAVLEAACDLYALGDEDGRVLHGNLAFAELCGVQVGELPGRVLENLRSGDGDRPNLGQLLLLAGPTAAGERVRSADLRSPSGCLYRCSTVALENGWVAVLGTKRDWPQSPAHLGLDRRALLERGASMAKLGFWVWDIEHDACIMYSEQLADLYGSGTEDCGSQACTLDTLLERMHPEDAPAYKECILSCRQSGASYDIEFRILTPSGESRYIREIGDYVTDAEGRIVRAEGVTQDISELKRRELEIAAARDQLSKQTANLKLLAKDLENARREAVGASMAKSDFLATVSHELRTPLNAIIGFSEIMKSRGLIPVPTERFTEYAEDIYASGMHLLRVIDDVLDLAKLEAGRVELEEEEFDLGELVAESLRLVAQRAEKTGLSMIIDPMASLPRVRADRRRMKQVILNLLSNAVKFTPAGGEVRTTASLTPAGDLELRIHDTGIGMEPEDIPIALAPFYQVGNVIDRKFEGTGLGLPLSKNLIELHEGTLAIESRPNTGTTAIVTLPGGRLVRFRAVVN